MNALPLAQILTAAVSILGSLSGYKFLTLRSDRHKADADAASVISAAAASLVGPLRSELAEVRSELAAERTSAATQRGAVRAEMDAMLTRMRDERHAQTRRDELHRAVLAEHNLWDVELWSAAKIPGGRAIPAPPPLYPPGWLEAVRLEHDDDLDGR